MTKPQWRWDAKAQNGDTYGGQMCAFGLHVQILTGAQEPGCKDEALVKGSSAGWVGHLGDAYGLLAGLWIDPKNQRAITYLITGTGDDPAKHKGKASGFYSWEETAFQTLAAR
jgi:D-alanyl-D-alanine carboxypeptidase